MSLLGSILDAGKNIAPLIGSAFGPVGGLIGAGVGGALGAWEGYEGQQEAKELQEKTWNREDTAVQRRVADLRAAGLSPTLAAGSAATSAPPISSMQQISGGEQERGFQGIQTAMALLGAKKQIEKTDAEIARIKADEMVSLSNAQLNSQRIGASQMLFDDPFNPGQRRPAYEIEQEYKTNMARWEYKINQQGSNQAEIKTEMMKAGLSAAQAEAAMAQIAAKQAGEVDEYFVPWLQAGTGAGYVQGAVGSILGKLRIPQ